MTHIRVSHDTHARESWHTYGWVMSHIRVSHVTHTGESCLTSDKSASCHRYEWVISHVWMSHVTHMNALGGADFESIATNKMKPAKALQTKRFASSRVLAAASMANPLSLNDFFWYVWHDSLTCVTWLTHMCDMTHSYVVLRCLLFQASPTGKTRSEADINTFLWVPCLFTGVARLVRGRSKCHCTHNKGATVARTKEPE